MSSILDTPPSDDNAGEICFGDCKDKLEKLKKDFLMLKKKIFCSQDLIKKFNLKIKENEKLSINLQAAQTKVKLTEEKLNNYVTLKSNTVKLKLENEKLKQTHKETMKKIEEYEVRIPGDEQLIKQLKCKVEDIEQKHSEKLMLVELEKSGLQNKIKELEREIRNLRKERDKADGKSPQKANEPKKRGRKPLKLQKATDLPFISNDVDVTETNVNVQQPSALPQESLESLNESKEINLIDIEVPMQIDFPKIILNDELKVDASDLKPNISKKPLCVDKIIMTDEFYDIKDNPYPLFCKKCRGLLNPVPIDEILDGMAITPFVTDFAPSLDDVNVKASSATSLDSSTSLKIFEKKFKKLEEIVFKLKKKQTQNSNPRCNQSYSNNCCDNFMNNNFSLMKMLTTFCSQMLTKKKKKKNRVKRLKRRKKKVFRDKNNFDNWDIESLLFEENSDVELEHKNSQVFTPLINFVNQNHSDNHNVNSDNARYLYSEKNLNKNNLINNSKQCLMKDVELVSNFECAPKPVNNEENMADKENNISHDNFSLTYESENIDDICNEPPTSLNVEPENVRKLKRKNIGSIKSNLLTKIRKLKSNSTTLPAKVFRNNNLINVEDNEEEIMKKRKRIAHVPKKISSDEFDSNSVDNNHSEEQSTLKGQRVTRSMVKCHPVKNKTVENESMNCLVTDDELDVNNSTSIIDNYSSSGNEKSNEEDNENSIIIENKIMPNLSLDTLKNKVNEIQSLSILNYHETEMCDEIDEFNNTLVHESDVDDEKEENEEENLPKVDEIDDEISENSIEKLSEDHEYEEIALESSKIVDESPASPDKNSSSEVTSEPLLFSSLYESVKLDECLSSTLTTESSEKATVIVPKVSENIDEHNKNCVKTLRNRTVSINSSKVHDTILLNDSTPCGNKNKFTSHNSLSLLDQYIARGKQKPGQKQIFLNEAAIKLAKGAEEYVKMELQNLIDSETWNSTINQEVADNLKTVNTRSLAKAVVEFMIKLFSSDEPLDRTFTPPAPMMTKSQQKIVALLQKIDTEKSIIFYILNNIEYALLRMNSDLTYEVAEELARIFTILAKIKKDRERVRIMCCDILYCLQKKGLVVLSAIIKSWPEILPSYNEDKFQYLPVCISYFVKSFKQLSNNTNTKILGLNKLIKNLYHYPDEFLTSKSFVDKLLNDLMTPDHDRSISTAIILLSKKEGSEWTYQNIIGGLLKMIVDYKSSNICEALKLLGYLMKSFPTTDENGSVGQVIDQLCAILDSGSTSFNIQEGVVFALLSLSRHNFNKVANSITEWYPSQNLSPELEEQLETFFNLRNIQFWKQFKNKKKKK